MRIAPPCEGCVSGSYAASNVEWLPGAATGPGATAGMVLPGLERQPGWKGTLSKRWIGVAFIILALAGCGGDDGSGNPGETSAGLASLGVGSTWTYANTFAGAGETLGSRARFRIADRRLARA